MEIGNGTKGECIGYYRSRVAPEKMVSSLSRLVVILRIIIRGVLMGRNRTKCKCGCGKSIKGNRYTYWPGHRRKEMLSIGSKPCICGCGNLANPGRRYINGHQKIGTVPAKEYIEKMISARTKNGTYRSLDEREKDRIVSLCACGCDKYASPGKQFIQGHNARGTGRSKPDPKPCACGCGELANSGYCYIAGHQTRSPKTRKKMSAAHKGKKYDLTRKQRLKMAENNYQYRNAHKEKGHLFLAGFEYNDLKCAVRERDNCACIICGCKPKSHIQTHHVVPLKIGYKSRLCDHKGNMICLCLQCHASLERRIDIDPDRWKRLLPKVISYLRKFYLDREILALNLQKE